MKAREPLPDSSKSNKATSDLMDSSSYIISELEAAYQTPKLWESEEKKPTPDPAKSNTKLKELYLQKFHNIHNIQDSSITSNSNQGCPSNESPETKSRVQEPRQSDELSLKDVPLFNQLRNAPEVRPSVKGRFEQFMSRYSSPDRQKSVPALDLAPLKNTSPTTPTPEKRVISQLTIEELLALTSKRSAQVKQGENNLTVALSKFSESNSMNESYQNDSPSNHNKIASKTNNHQLIAPEEVKVNSTQIQAQKSLEKPSQKRPISKKANKSPKQKSLHSSESKDRSRSNGNNNTEQFVGGRLQNFDDQLKSKNQALSTLKKKKEYKILLEISKKEQIDRQKEISALKATLTRALEEKEKLQKDFENLSERLTIYEKSASTSEANRRKRELSHQLNCSKIREISLEERCEKIEQSLKHEKEKNSKLNASVLVWKTRWENRKHEGLNNSRFDETQLQLDLFGLGNQGNACRNDLFHYDSQHYSSNELQTLRTSLNEVTAKLKEMQSKVNQERTKRVQLEEELAVTKAKLAEQVNRSLSKNPEKKMKSETNNEEKLKTELLLKDKELKQTINELNELKIWLEKAQETITVLKAKESEHEKKSRILSSQTSTRHSSPKDNRSFALEISNDTLLEAALKDSQYREDALRRELKEKQAQIGDLTTKLAAQEGSLKKSLDFERIQAQKTLSDEGKQDCKITLEKLVSKIKVLLKQCGSDVVSIDQLKPESMIDQALTTVSAVLSQNGKLKSELKARTEDLQRLQNDYENSRTKCDEFNQQLMSKEKEITNLKNKNEELSKSIIKLQKEHQELLQRKKETQPLGGAIDHKATAQDNLQVLRNLEQELESKNQVIINLENNQTHLETKLAETLEELTLSKAELRKMSTLQAGKDTSSGNEEIKALKVTVANKEAQIAQTQKEIVSTVNDEKIKTLEEINKRLEAQLSDSKSRIGSLEHDIVSLQGRLSHLKSNQEATVDDSDRKSLEADEIIMRLNEELKKSRLERETLATQKNEESATLQNSLKEANKMLESARLSKEEEVSLQNQMVVGLKNRVQELELEVKSQEQSRKGVNHQQEVSKMREKDLKASKEEIDELNMRLKNYEDQISRITIKAERERNQQQLDWQTLLSKQAALEETIDNLRNELDAERLKLINGADAQEELKRAHKEVILEMESRHAISLKEKDAIILASNEEITKLKEQIIGHETLIATFKQSSSTAEETLRFKITESESRINQLLFQINEINSSKELLSEQLSRSQEKISKLEQENSQQQLHEKDLLINLSQLQLQIAEFEKKVESLEGELIRKEETISTTKFTRDAAVEESIKQLNENLSQAESTILDMQCQIAALLPKVSAGEEVAKQLEIQKAAVKLLEEDKRTLVQENELLKANAEELEQEVTKFKKSRYDARKSIRGEENIAVLRLREEVRVREEQIASLEKSNKSVKDHYELQLKSANATILELCNEQAKLLSGKGGATADKKAQLKAQELENMNLIYKQEIEHFRFLFEDQETRIQENEKQTKDLTKKLQETEEQFEKLKNEQEETQEELENVKSSLDAQKKLLKKYQDQNKTLMAEKDDLTNKLTECEAALEHYQNEMTRYIDKINDVQNSEHKMRQENEALKKKKTGWKLF